MKSTGILRHLGPPPRAFRSLVRLASCLALVLPAASDPAPAPTLPPRAYTFPDWQIHLPSRALELETDFPAEWQLAELRFRRVAAEARVSDPERARHLERCYRLIWHFDEGPWGERQAAEASLISDPNPVVQAYAVRIDSPGDGHPLRLGAEPLTPKTLPVLANLVINSTRFPGSHESPGSPNNTDMFAAFVNVLVERSPLKDKSIGPPQSRYMWCAVPWLKNALLELAKEPGWDSPDLVPPLLAEIDRVVATHFHKSFPDGLPASPHPQEPPAYAAARLDAEKKAAESQRALKEWQDAEKRRENPSSDKPQGGPPTILPTGRKEPNTTGTQASNQHPALILTGIGLAMALGAILLVIFRGRR